MQKKILKNLLIVVVMAVLCLAVGVTASAGNYEDIWTQGFANENQAVLVFNLNGGKIDGTVENFNLETMSYETVIELSGKYVMVPKNETEQVEKSSIVFPSIIAPDEYHEVIGWHLAVQNTIYATGSRYYIPISTAGTVIEFSAIYEDYTPYNFVDGILTAGEKLTWSFDETTGILEISGVGAMYAFDGEHYFCPWEAFRDDIRTVIIGEGVTTIGDSAFGGCINLTNIEMPDTIIKIGREAFVYCYRLEKVVLPESIKTIGDNAFFACLGLTEVTIPKDIEAIGYEAFVVLPFLEKITVKSMNVILGELSIGVNEFAVPDMSREDFVDLFGNYLIGDITDEEFEKHIEYSDSFIFIGTIYCHSGSTAETYAIENGVDYVLTHFFEGDWNYDYDNMIRYRKCIHCDELEIEELETTTDSDVEIIEPNDPDTDFVVDVITDYVVIEETIANNVVGDFEIVKAFDITMKNSDGVHVQPDGTVKVKLPLDWSKDGIYKVYRVNDDGTLTDMNAYREGSHMVFDTDHFSVYVIVDESEKTDTPAETPEEETKDNFFSKIIDLIKSFFELIVSWFRK